MSREEEYAEKIKDLTRLIEQGENLAAMYYERGFIYFLSEDEEKAKEDYKSALNNGIDPTELPYYAFTNSNSLRRPFLLPEKIMIFLLLIIILTVLVLQVLDFIAKIPMPL